MSFERGLAGNWISEMGFRQRMTGSGTEGAREFEQGEEREDLRGGDG